MRITNRVLCAITVAAISVFMVSCKKVTGEGPIRTESRERAGFSEVDVRVSGNIYVKKYAAYKLEVSAQQNVLEYLETNVVGNKLVIKFRDGVKVKAYDDIVINVSSPEIYGARLSGSGNVYLNGALSQVNFWTQVSGSGNLTIDNLVTNNLDATISGSGNIKVQNGSAVEESLKISGSGNIDVVNIKAKSAFTTTSGSGSIRLQATDHLNVTIAGSGSVFYLGNPIISTKISGSGSVVHL